VVKRAVLLSTGTLINTECLPASVLSAAPPVQVQGATQPVSRSEEGLRGVAHQAERDAILTALERNGFNKSRTAEQLNIDRKTLYNKLRAFGLAV
jgi:two-component system response regulator HydG